uniref:Disease resistance protein n=1 Tax=Strongyloides papillosus TaxID=174720 RepID=A0A0N5CA37_STREA
MALIHRGRRSPLMDVMFVRLSVRRYITDLKKDINSAETFILLGQLRHQQPKNTPSWMRVDSFTLIHKFWLADPYSEFETIMHEGEACEEDIPDYVRFDVDCGDIEKLYEKLLESPFCTNVKLVTYSDRKNPLYFPLLNAPLWKGLLLHNDGPIAGDLPPLLEMLVLDPVHPADGTDYGEIMEGLSYLKVLVIKECSLLAYILDLQAMLPSLEVLVCQEVIEECSCYEAVEYFLPQMMKMVPSPGNQLRNRTWGGHVYYANTDVLSEICDVQIPDEFRRRLDTMIEGQQGDSLNMPD